MNNRGDSTSEFPVRDHSAVALACIVVAFAAVNSVLQLSSLIDGDDYEFSLCLGILVVQPLCFGMWTALGPGSILTRLPIALPCLMLLFVAPGNVDNAFANLQLGEFIVAVLFGFAIFAFAMVLFLAFRKISGLRLHSHPNQVGDSGRFKFSTKYLLALMTVYAVAFGMTMQLQFLVTPPPAGRFGTGYFIVFLVFGGTATALVLLPILSIPLLILYGNPSRCVVRWLVVFWLMITSAVAAFLSTGNLFSPGKALMCLFLAQCGATVLVSIAASCLRFSGLRLVRYG